jgi:hypothetical protein
MSRIVLKTDARQAKKELKDTAAAAEEITDEFKQTKREADKLTRQVKKGFQEARTPMEKFKGTLRDLKQLQKANRISMDEYSHAVRRARHEMRTASQSPFMKQISGMGGSLGRFAGPAAAGASVVGLLREMVSAIQDLRDTQLAQFEDVKAEQTAAGPLFQFKDAPFLREFGRTIARDVGIKGEQTQPLVFALRSAGILGEEGSDTSDAKFIARMKRVRFLANTEEAASAFAAANTAFGVGLRKTLAQSIAAAGGAPDLAERLLIQGSRSKAAEGAGTLGIEQPEFLAAMGTLAKALGGAEGAGRGLNNLLAGIEKARGKGIDIEGENLIQMLASITQLEEERGMQLREILGDNEQSIAAVRVLRDQMELFTDTIGSAAEATATSIEKSVAAAERLSAVQIRISQDLERRTQESEAESERAALRANREENIRHSLRQNANPLARRFGGRAARVAGDVLEMLGITDTSAGMEAAGMAGATVGIGGGLDANEIASALVRHMSRIEINTEGRPIPPGAKED